MTIFINNKSTKYCQITMCIIKRFIHKRKVVPFFLPQRVYTSKTIKTINTK